MEAQLNFLTPNITAIILGMGQFTFSRLNKLKLGICIIIVLSLIFDNLKVNSVSLYAIPILIMTLQSSWLLTILNGGMDLILADQSLPSTNYQITYTVLKVGKARMLMLAGIKYLKK